MTTTKQRSVQRKVLRQVLLAQAASDSGKGIFWDTNVPGYDSAMMGAYAVKVEHELAAIRLINSVPPCGISYWVGGDHAHSPIVYFSFEGTLCGKWRQISFHNPGLPREHPLRQMFRKGRQTSWAGLREPADFQDSIQCCSELAKNFGWYISRTN